MEKIITLVLFILLTPLCTEVQAQSLKVIATGTGQTTGHIANLSITNTTGQAVKINPQKCYIPSGGTYQPYVATIPATSVPPGTSSIQVDGYCANVDAKPVPAENPMPPVSEWIPVIQPGIIIPQGGNYILTTPAIAAFKAEDIQDLVQSPGYTPFNIKESSAITTTWPITNILFEGTITPESHPKPFAPVLVEALNSISTAFDKLKLAGDVNTPFSGDPQKEREAVIQQTFWIYTARITGKEYNKEDFSEKVIKQFEDSTDTKVKSLSQEEMQKLENGIEAFWNTFTNLRIEAKLLIGTKNESVLASTTNTILPPWDKIALTDERMKPGSHYGKAGVPWIPLIGGAVAAGTLVYFATQGDDEDDPIIDCAFTANATRQSSTCGLSNGAIVVTVNPPGAYTYQWSNGAMTPILVDIPAGNYSVTVSREGTTCTQVVQANVANVDKSFTATISAQNADCDQQNGSVSVTPSPPSSYMYQWSNGATTQNQSNLPPGNYMVTISAGGTCEKTFSAQIQSVPFDPTISFTTTPSTCGGSDGAATVLVNPPVQYTYAWSNGQSSSTISGLTAGSYSVTVSKPGTSCTKVANVVVDDVSGSFSVSISSTMSGCGLSNGIANAIVNPPGAYDFIWSNGQTTQQISGLAEGSYTVTVTITGTTCSEDASVTISETPASFVVSLTSTQASCGVSDGTATATVNPPGTYTYAWSNGQSGSQITGLAPGNYSVTVTQGIDCSQQGSIAVASTPFPHTISLNTTPSSCGGTDGTVTTNVTPPGEFNYQWSNGQTVSQLSGVGAGTYTVTVTIPGTNCSKTATTTVEEIPATFTVSVSTTPAGCGLSNGTATTTVNPPGNYDYTWSNGQTGSQISGVMAGAYTVTVSIAGTSCSQIENTTVAELPPSFTLSFTSTPAGCGMTNGSAAVMVNPPGAYTYLWSNGSAGTQITNVGTGTYTVTVTVTGTACSTTGSVDVEQTGGGGFTATFTTENAACGFANGSATITVSPSAEYTYLWSNQQTGATLNQVATGTYSVTVTDINGCVESFSVTVGQDAAEYITILSTTPGTCTGGGNIRFTVFTPGVGPLDITIEGPSGTNMISVGPGVYDLSSFMAVVPGSYTMTVTDHQIGPYCSEIVSASVADNTPATDLENDFYATEGVQPVQENALVNDLGFNLQMTQVDNENGGTVTFMPNGNFTFIADIGFSGEASFVYTVTDACGNTSSALVTIVVEEVPCAFDVDFESTPASCGLEDGSITVIVSEPGDYEYEWSNGDSGPTIEDVPPGEYAVTITDLSIGCIFEATFILEGLPVNYIEDIEVIQPSCEAGGDIEFIAVSPGGNTLHMLVEHPFGGAEFNIDAGLIHLSDYVTTVPGTYFVEVSDPIAGPGCSESFTVTLNQPPTPVIEVIEIFPPSSPGAMDGSAFVEVTTPGQLPYAIYLDGLFAFTINQQNFFLIGLGAGVHTVWLVDITACQSNTVEFFVPMSEPIFEFGFSVTDAGSYSVSDEQPSVYHPGSIWRSVLSGSYRFDVGRIQQDVRIVYAPTLRMNTGESVNGFIAMEYLSGPQDIRWKGIGLRAQGGLGTYYEQHDPAVKPTSEPVYWLVRASVEHSVFKRILLTGSVSARGWDFIAPISWEFGFRVPFYSWSKSAVHFGSAQ